MQPAVIGIDVGGTNMSGGLATLEGALLAKVRRATDRGGGMRAGLALITELASDLLAEAGRDERRVESIGIGFGGPVDHQRGIVLRSHHVEGWGRVPLREELEGRYHIPVTVDNDANTGTLGEWRFGAGRGVDDLLYVNIGTGIGGGIVAGGRLVRGAADLAGEIGHVVVKRDGAPCACGKRGCLESCASGEAIARRATEALGRPVTGKELFALAGANVMAACPAPDGRGAARPDDPARAANVLAEIIEDLAHGIGIAVSLVNPALVIIGGGLSEAPEALFLGPLRRAIPRYCLAEMAKDLRVEAAELRYDAGVMGAVALALSATGHQ